MKFAYSLFALFVLFSSFTLAYQLPYETAAVGRVQGDSLFDLESALGKERAFVSGADYYKYNGRPVDESTYYTSHTNPENILGEVYGGGNVYFRDWRLWDIGYLTNPTPSNELLILQTQSTFENGSLKVKDGSGVPYSVSSFNLGNAIQGDNIVIADAGYAGTYLPTMSASDSFSSQLAGKAGALIASNGLANPALVKSLICSLALEDASFGKNDYYYFNSIGDRFRNARNNLVEFGESTAPLADYSLYALPFMGVDGKKLSSEQLRKFCGDFATYNTHLTAVSGDAFIAQSIGESSVKKVISLDFSDYSVVQDESGFDLITFNNALQQDGSSGLVLPKAVVETEFPLGTIVKGVSLISRSERKEVLAENLPSSEGDSFTERNCNSFEQSDFLEFSSFYTEDSVIVTAYVNPVEVLDCEAGLFGIYENAEIEVDYSSYSPVLIKDIDVENNVFPKAVVPVNVSLENISLSDVSGKLVLKRGETVVASFDVSIPSGSIINEQLSFESGKDEGFYDYVVEFEENEEAKTSRNFKIKVEAMIASIDFKGSGTNSEEDFIITYPNSARGDVLIGVIFENNTDSQFAVNADYLLLDSSGEIVDSGKFNLTVPKGVAKKELIFPSLYDPLESYQLTVDYSYDSGSGIVSSNFFGNNLPVITAPGVINADAYDTVKLDYSIYDPDGDSISLTVSEPFVNSTEWKTGEEDIGNKEVTILASDGFESVSKIVSINVGPPVVECSSELDCGGIIVTDPRTCDSGLLYKTELLPVCNNPGTFESYCSREELVTNYGYCKDADFVTDDDTVDFDSDGGRQVIVLDIPRDANVTSASVEVKAEAPKQMCFGLFDSYNKEKSDAIIHRFANGSTFFGLPLGDYKLVGSQDVTSDVVEGFPNIIFTPSESGVLSFIELIPFCPAYTNGSFLHVTAYCEGGGSMSTPNMRSLCDASSQWRGAGFDGQYTDSEIKDFCEWSISEKTLSISHDLKSLYGGLKGYWQGIGQNYPAFRAYIRQFQSGKTIYLGDMPYKVKSMHFTADEDLRGQAIKYYVTVDGENWKEVQTGADYTFNIEETKKAFAWKAVLETTAPEKTPRINSAEVCIDTYGSPGNFSVALANVPLFDSSGSAAFNEDIQFSAEVNYWISRFNSTIKTVHVPIVISAASTGYVDLSDIAYSMDLPLNTPPSINQIGEINVFAGEKKAFYLMASDIDRDQLTYSDDSELFDVQPKTGLIVFTPSQSDVGMHTVSVTVSDGVDETIESFVVNVSSSGYAGCFDSDDSSAEPDSGKSTKGFVLSGNGFYADSCSSGNYLYETICKGGSVDMTPITCASGVCFNGACTQKSEDIPVEILPDTGVCHDTDSGINPYLKGSVLLSKPNIPVSRMTDECWSKTGLYDYYCDSSGYSAYGYELKTYACPYGCYEGVCLPEPN